MPKIKVFVHQISIVLLRRLKGHQIITVFWTKQMVWNQRTINGGAEMKMRYVGISKK
jgi:hypothetical protein